MCFFVLFLMLLICFNQFCFGQAFPLLFVFSNFVIFLFLVAAGASWASRMVGFNVDQDM